MGQIIKMSLVLSLVLLAIVQIPLDIRFRQLSRRATAVTTVVVVVSLAVDTWLTNNIAGGVHAFLWALVIGGSYLLLHRLAPHSLGFGDVLLVLPLTLAVAYGDAYEKIESVLYWQFLAACTGTLHAVVMRVWSRKSSIPFGPHLLLSALAVLTLSL